MEDFLAMMPERIAPWIAIPAGCALLFAGRFLYQLALWGLGAVVGVGAGFLLMEQIPADAGIYESISSNVLTVIVTVLGGIAGALIFHYLQLFAFFLFGALIGGWAVVHCWRNYPELLAGISPDVDLSYSIALPLIALAVGLAAVALQKWLIIALSSALGGILIAEGLDLPVKIAAAAGIAAVGFIFQGVILERIRNKKRWIDVEPKD